MQGSCVGVDVQGTIEIQGSIQDQALGAGSQIQLIPSSDVEASR